MSEIGGHHVNDYEPTLLEEALWTGWERKKIEQRIAHLQRRIHSSGSMDRRASLRADVDMLLEEYHARFVQPKKRRRKSAA